MACGTRRPAKQCRARALGCFCRAGSSMHGCSSSAEAGRGSTCTAEPVKRAFPSREGPMSACVLPPPHGCALLFLTHHFSLGVLTPIYEAVPKTSDWLRNKSSFHRVTFCHSAPNPRVAFGTVGMPCPRHSTAAVTSSTGRAGSSSGWYRACRAPAPGD